MKTTVKLYKNNLNRNITLTIKGLSPAKLQSIFGALSTGGTNVFSKSIALAIEKEYAKD